METGCQGGQVSPRAVAPGGWMDLINARYKERTRRYQWPRGLRHRSTADRLLRLWVRTPSGAWMFVCCDCCVLSGRGLCDEIIIRPEESYRLRCVVVCGLETIKILVNEEAKVH
jgi:hypothetical protein